MARSTYSRSILWRFVFFGLPIAAFCLMFFEVSDWDKPLAGPVALEEEELGVGYRTAAVFLGAMVLIPYLGIALRLSERLHVSDTLIRRRRLFTNRTLHWDDVIEYRDFRNYIHLVPAEESLGIYIDYYMTFQRGRELARFLSRKCREVDANMMVSRRRRRLVPCDMGVGATLVFVVASGLLLFLLRQRIVLLGALSGIALTIAIAWVWLVTRRRAERWKSGGFVYVTLFLLFLILPPAYFVQSVSVQGIKTVGTLGLLYLAGLLAGSGLMAALLPSRKITS